MKRFFQNTSKFLFSLLFITSMANAEECKMTVGYHNQPPILYPDKNNKIQGLDKELIELITKKIDCKVEWVDVPWARAQEMMKEGTLTMSSNALNKPEREVYANMIAYRKDNPNKLYVKKDTFEKVKANNLKEFLDNNSKGSIGIVIGTKYDDEIEQLINNPAYSNRFSKVSDAVSNIDKLLNDRIIGLITEQLLGNYYLKERKLKDSIDKYAFTFGFDENRQVYFIISKKADPEGKITKKIVSTVAELRNDPNYNKIIDNYFN